MERFTPSGQRWLTSPYHTYTVTCSRCRYVAGNFHQYCPNCGAYMENGKRVETNLPFDGKSPESFSSWKMETDEISD